MTRSSRSPAAANRAAYSASVRSMPPVTTSIAASISLIVVGSLPGGMIVSATRTLPCGCVPAIAQDAHRLFVIPVVNDLLQNVRVRASRNRLEEAPRHEIGMWRKIPSVPPRRLNHGWQVEQQAGDVGMSFEDLG